jgi:hypothetical protein
MLTLKEFRTKNKKQNLSLREQFFQGMIFNVGQVVSVDEQFHEILDRGTNYVTVVSESGKVSKRFIQNLTLVEHTMQYPAHTFKGVFVNPDEAMSSTIPFTKTIQEYNTGRIKDALAIIKSITAVNELLNEGTGNIDSIKQSLERIGQWEVHSGYLSKYLNEVIVPDKLKVAMVIAENLGQSSKGTNAEMIVNTALRKTKLHNEEAVSIVKKMLELADSVGVKYDQKIIAEMAKAPEPVKTKKRQDVKESYALTTPVTVTKNSGRTMHGVVKGMHGSVVEIKHGNNKVSFHHVTSVSEREAALLDADMGGEESTEGFSLGAPNETIRQMMVQKLAGN